MPDWGPHFNQSKRFARRKCVSCVLWVRFASQNTLFESVTLPWKLTRFTPLKRGPFLVWLVRILFFFRIISAHNARFLFLFTLELRWVKYNIFWNRVFQHTMLGFDFYLPWKNDGSKIIAPFFGLFLPAKIIVLVNFLRKFRDFSGVWIFLWERWSFLIGNEIAKKMIDGHSLARARTPWWYHRF